MTQMQTPYQDQSDVTLYQEPDRTSIMAILSLVLGVGGCCLGVTSIPAILLGIFGLIAISRSRGRVGGTGFGIAGILIGLLTLALWGGLLGAGVFGLSEMREKFGGKTETVLLSIQSDHFDAVRTEMDPPGSELSDEDLIAFREAYRSSLGDFVANSDSIWDLLSGYMTVGEQIQRYNGQQGFIPLPVRFDSGWALVIYVIDPHPSSSSAGIPDPIGYIIVDTQGNEYRLPETLGTLPPSSRRPAPADQTPDQGADLDAGADDDGESQTPIGGGDEPVGDEP